MRLDRSPLLRLFRTLVMGVLVLAIVAKPVLAELCNVHELMHLIAAGEPASKPPIHVDSVAEARSDKDHASGAHQLLHAFDASAAYVELFPALTAAPAQFAHIAPPVHEAIAPAARAFDSPFRPPIA
jgi:HAMP domain-containing protein